MPKKHEPKNIYMMMNEKIAHTFKNFKSKRERGMTLENTKLRKIFHTLAKS
jgi:hypothetical protein